MLATIEKQALMADAAPLAAGEKKVTAPVLT